MTHTFAKQYTIYAESKKYGSATIALNLSFNNETNSSTLTIDGNFVMGGQTTGYTANGETMAANKATNKSIKLYSLNALTKLGTNHIYLYKDGEVDFNKQTRFVCDLTFFAMTIKNDIYNWRKSLANEK